MIGCSENIINFLDQLSRQAISPLLYFVVDLLLCFIGVSYMYIVLI